MRRSAFCATIAALAVAAPSVVLAAERVAVIMGNNVGATDETELRYAEDDAERIQRVLHDLGGFGAEDMVLLRGESTETARRAIIRANDRLRNEANSHGTLIVYYSGHADQQGLHLGASRFPLEELEALVRGSPARTRILVVDACRSGGLTRVKGHVEAPPFDIRARRSEGSEGAVFLTSSAANEDAQESDELRGSFFTHYLVSALVGAADSDGDGRVTLSEAYAYAYEGTLRASSRSVVGLQHPTFSYEVRGREEIVLTNLAEQTNRPAGQLRLPAGRRYLVIRDGPEGSVMAETDGRASRLILPPGRYFVRGRGDRDLLEGTARVQEGEASSVEEDRLERVAYARLVRKGGDAPTTVAGVHAGYLFRTGLWPGFNPCHGIFAAYETVRRGFSLMGRIAACRSGYANATLTSTADELSFQLEGAHVWDLRFVSPSLGLALGPAFFHQTFVTRGEAPTQNALAGVLTASAGVEIPLVGRFLLAGAGGANVYLLKQRDAAGRTSLSTPVSFVVRIGLVARW